MTMFRAVSYAVQIVGKLLLNGGGFPRHILKDFACQSGHRHFPRA